MLKAVTSLLSRSPSGCKLVVLIYHRVPAQPDPLLPSEPDARVFDWQMREIATYFRVLRLSEAIARLKAGKLAPRSACITFDDGYADNASVALPILRRHGLVATFFITTGTLDGGRMWNDSVIEAVRVADSGELDLDSSGLGVHRVGDVSSRLATVNELIGRIKYRPTGERAAAVADVVARVNHKIRNDLMMTSEQVRQLAHAGMEIGAHTVTHSLLRDLTDAEARHEVEGSRSRLREITDASVPVFAYPNGRPGKDYGPRDVALVRALGFDAAVSTAWGAGTARSDPLQVPRFTPWDRTPKRFLLRLIHNYTRTAEQRV
jgi:peptidoglycan/xylan/chitin deacetylase (PgdA/CDA1 family)